MQLVEIKKLDLVTNSAVIASGVMKDHKPVIQLIRKYKSDLEEFGRVEFEMRPFQTDGGMQKQEIALLNEQQTTLLITYMRNNEVVRAFKKRLVSEFFAMRGELAKKKMDRNAARLEYKPMTEAIKHERESQGKQIAPHHFSNEADLISSNYSYPGRRSCHHNSGKHRISSSHDSGMDTCGNSCINRFIRWCRCGWAWRCRSSTRSFW
ncbi:Rha family transcriptional regulator [Cronobacter sakazakii]